MARTKKLSRWERAGLKWTAKEREVLIEGRRGRWDRKEHRYVFKSYKEIYLELLNQRPQRLNEHDEPVNHSMASIYKEAQRPGITGRNWKIYRAEILL